MAACGTRSKKTRPADAARTVTAAAEDLARCSGDACVDAATRFRSAGLAAYCAGMGEERRQKARARKAYPPARWQREPQADDPCPGFTRSVAAAAERLDKADMATVLWGGVKNAPVKLQHERRLAKERVVEAIRECASACGSSSGCEATAERVLRGRPWED